jgi:radical SAM superfamily enzyme YgiQ (UPF0313 family)
MPLGLAMLGAACKDHEVRVLDLNQHPAFLVELERGLLEFAPQVVGVSLRNIDSTNKRRVTFYYAHLEPTLATIRRAAPGAVIILGGAAFSMYAERVMNDQPEADLGLMLEGEASLPHLLANLDNLAATPGVYWRQGAELRFSGPPSAPGLASLAPPAWELLDVPLYSKLPFGVGVETKRGCALACAYCPYPFLSGRGYRLKSPSAVADEIQNLHQGHGVKEFTFVDSVFNLPRQHAQAVCEELLARKLGVKWSAWFNEQGLTRDFVLLAKEAGCNNFIFSPDGFSDRALAALGKNVTLADIKAAYELMRSLPGTKVSYNFFKNPPGQSLGAACALLKFMFQAKREMGGPRVSFELNSIRVEPHTRLREIALAQGQISASDDLLEPRYYKNPGTGHIEAAFNLLLRLKGK